MNVFKDVKSCFAILLLLIAISTNAQQTRGITAVEPTTEPAGVRRALVIGISKYNEDRPLTSAVADAKLVKGFLSESKFYANNITLLSDSDANNINVVTQLKKIVEASKVKDEVVIYFSGDYERSVAGDAAYLLMYGVARDAASMPTSDVLDASILKSYMDRMAKNGVKVTLLVEASHAGDIARDWTNDTTITALFSCMGKETNKEKQLDKGKTYGAFTYYLLDGLKGKADANGDNAVTLEEMKFYLRQQLRELSQNPVVVGAKDQVILKVELTKTSDQLPVNTVAPAER